MRSLRLTLAPGIGDVRALGAASARELIEAGSGLWGEPYAEVLATDRESREWRVPLPGTAVGGLALLGRPAGERTGWVRLRRYVAAPWRARLAARFSTPHSHSLAAREWNLLCHLRRAGVTAPEPLALADEAHALCAARSALVTRELAAFRPARAWFAHVVSGAARRRGLVALGRTLSRAVLTARVALPRLSGDGILLAVPDAEGECAAHAASGLALRNSSEAALADVRGARILAAPSPRHLQLLLARLDREARSLLAPRERLRVASVALAGLDRGKRRAILRRLLRAGNFR